MGKYHYAGDFCGKKIYLESGEKLNWLYKVPIFFMRILPSMFIKGEKDE